jgi:hypothetical protein
MSQIDFFKPGCWEGRYCTIRITDMNFFVDRFLHFIHLSKNLSATRIILSNVFIHWYKFFEHQHFCGVDLIRNSQYPHDPLEQLDLNRRISH